MKHWTDNKAAFSSRRFSCRYIAALCIALICCMLAACGGHKEAADGEDTVVRTETGTEDTNVDGASSSAEASSEDAVMEQDALTETGNEESTYSGSAVYEESIAAAADTELAEGESPYYGVMHASIIDINGNVGDSATVYSFKDKMDTENIWSVTGLEIGDIEADMAVGNDVAILFNGDIVRDAENLQFMVILPEGAYTLMEAEGVTTGSTMSVFSIETADGTSIDFLKDNCRMDDNILKSEYGDRVRVYYAHNEQYGNYPLRVYAAR